MKYKTAISVILSITAVSGGMILNFPQFLMESPATLKNLVVTIAYVVTWIFALIIGIRSMSRRVKRYFCMFWAATLIFSMLTVYVNLTGIYAGWAIPFVILLLTPWYGICFLIDDFMQSAIVIALISSGMLVYLLKMHSKLIITEGRS